MLASALTTGTAVACMAAGVLMTFLWRLVLARRVWLAGATRPFDKVSAYQLALMNGGAARVSLVAVVRLLANKALVPGTAGVIVKNGDLPGELDSFEREAMTLAPVVLAGLVTELAMKLRSKGMIAGLRRELTGMGYMRSFASPRWWLDYVVNMIPFAILIAIMLAMPTLLAPDLDRLWTFVPPAMGLMLMTAWPTPVTPFGRYIIWSATRHHPDYKTARAREGEKLDTKKLGQAVALYGYEALADSDMAWIPAILTHAEKSGTND